MLFVLLSNLRFTLWRLVAFFLHQFFWESNGFMGHMKNFRIFVYCCREIPRFVSDEFFFLHHSLIIFFLFVEAIKEWTSQYLFSDCTTISWQGIFSWTSRNNPVLPSRHLKNTRESFLVKLLVCEYTICLCVQWVRSTEAATSRRHNALLGPRPEANVRCHW